MDTLQSAPFRRIYVDLPAEAAAKLDILARQRGLTKKDFLAALIHEAAQKESPRAKRQPK